MRALRVAILLMAALAFCGTATAGELKLHKRTVEYRIVEPCDVVVAEGTAVLEWDDCGGAFELITIDYENYPHPITVLLYAGNPDWSELDRHTYTSFFCECRYTCKRPDVYCADCNPCCWYCYRTEVGQCAETVCALAYLPSCMALDILDVY